jgi:hypothetical protein
VSSATSARMMSVQLSLVMYLTYACAPRSGQKYLPAAPANLHRLLGLTDGCGLLTPVEWKPVR